MVQTFEVQKSFMVSRRSFLWGTGTLALAHLLSACSGSREAALRVELLRGSIPVQLLKQFERASQIRDAAFTVKAQLADLFDSLQIWQRPVDQSNSRLPFIGGNQASAPIADFVTLGDYWLTAAIQQQLIQPLALSDLEGWQTLPPQWQAIVTRNNQGQLDPQGQIWAAPYRWGSLAIAYRVDDFESLGWTPQNWSDLWRPELKRQISILDDARVGIGLTLKKLGRSVNEDNVLSVPTLEAELRALNEQVKFYSSTAYLQPLLEGDTSVAVGWSTDLLPIVRRNPYIQAVVPASGTILFSDVWVRPAKAAQLATRSATENSAPEPSAAWLNFCWSRETALQLSLLSDAASPIVVGLDRSQLPPTLEGDRLLLPDAAVLAKSDFLHPLSEAIAEEYRRLWSETRQTG